MSETTSTAVTTRPADLPPAESAELARRRAQNLMVQQIKGTVWSKDFDANTMRAVAQYCHENDLDPVTEVHVLGGNLHIGARYYERKLQELVGADRIEYARADWVHRDDRLDTLAAGGDAWAIEESARRTRERILHNLTDTADAACVFRIKVKGMLEEVVGAKEHIPGRKITIKKKDGGSFTKDADPIGDLAPRETIETRALRRAMLKLAKSMPQLRLASANDDSAVEISAVISRSEPATPRFPAALPSASRDAYGEALTDHRVAPVVPDVDPYEAAELEAETEDAA